MDGVRPSAVAKGVVAGIVIVGAVLAGAFVGFFAAIGVGLLLLLGSGGSGGDLIVSAMIVSIPLSAVCFGFTAYRIVRRLWPNP